MTYTESAALMEEPVFHGRVKVACLKFAQSILIEDPATPNHEARLIWARYTMQAPEQAATQVQPPTVIDPAVQAAGALIEDAALQASVETVAVKLM